MWPDGTIPLPLQSCEFLLIMAITQPEANAFALLGPPCVLLDDFFFNAVALMCQFCKIYQAFHNCPLLFCLATSRCSPVLYFAPWALAEHLHSVLGSRAPRAGLGRATVQSSSKSNFRNWRGQRKRIASLVILSTLEIYMRLDFSGKNLPLK